MAQICTNPAMGVRTSCSVCLLLTNTLAAVYRSSYLFYGPQFMSREHEDLKGGVVDILRPNQVLNTEQYNVNQQKISQLRELASKMEQTNEEAHRRFIEQDLRRRVEEGERARSVEFYLMADGHTQVYEQANAGKFEPP